MKKTRTLPLLTLVLVGGVLLASVPLRSEDPKPEDPKRLTGTEIADKLETRFSFPVWNDPKMTVSEALEQVAKITGVPIEINSKTFAEADIQDVEKYTLLFQEKQFPASKVSLSRLLRRLLDRLPASSRGLWVIRDDGIELTTAKVFSDEIGRGGNDQPEVGTTPTVPLVYAVLEKKPLEQALKSLADRTGFSIVLDVRAGDKGKTLVTAGLKNVPLDTAVSLLADMADLRSALIDNTIFVTTPENADRREAEQARRRFGPMGQGLGALGGGFGGGGMLGGGMLGGGVGNLGNPPKAAPGPM